ncbi:site-specific DNA-methyltransferase [Rhodococcus sp. WS3]|nr:site-specific DNA-methyltransferase [Rhodococcus sp. WS3]
MEKLRMTSPDVTAANIDKLAELFPYVVTESVDADGNPKKAIDFDLLRQELSGHVVEGPQERYQLDWPGKRAAAFVANAPIAKTLRPVRVESVDFDTTKNLFIEGDNLEALKLLQESYLGKVKLIYIDPPYNTGNDFVYKDEFAESTAEYLIRSGQTDNSGTQLSANMESSGRFHSDWLSMIYPRLKLARNLLTDDGVIIASIDDTEVSSLREVMDFTFGKQNYIATVVWQGGRKNDSRYVSVGHDYLLIYARNENRLQEQGTRWRERKVGVDDALEAARSAWETSRYDAEIATQTYRGWLSNKTGITPAVSRFKNIDNSGRVYNSDKDLGWPGGGGPRFEVLHPVTGKPVSIPSTGWRFTETSMKEQIEAGLVEFGADERKIPRGKTFLDELDEQVAESIFTQIRTTASQRLTQLIGPGVFDYPKDEYVLARWFDLVTKSDPNAIILDFFAGSGSSAHAVLHLNSLDGGTRKFIAAQINEETPIKSPARAAGFENIAQITRERIRQAGLKLRDEAGLEGDNLDIGFRALKIDSTNMADVLRTPDETEQLTLGDLESSVKPDRSGEDLLFQVMLDWGLELTMPIAVEKIDEREVFVVEDGALIACFDAGISPELVRIIAKREPLRAVFRDSSFASDDDRINAEQVFREVSPATDVKAI